MNKEEGLECEVHIDRICLGYPNLNIEMYFGQSRYRRGLMQQEGGKWQEGALVVRPVGEDEEGQDC